MFKIPELTPLSLLSGYKNAKELNGSESLIGYTRSTRVEPIVLIDQEVELLPYADDILKSLLAIFTGYYMLGVSVTVNVGRINVIKLLDHLNPERDYGKAIMSSLESAVLMQEHTYASGLPRLNLSEDNASLEVISFGIEAKKNKPDPKDTPKEDPKPPVTTVKIGGKGYTDAIESGNLAIGNVIQVDIEDGGSKATIPVMIRLIPSVARADVLTHILSKNERDLSLLERMHELMSGQISFWKDLIFCQDLIDAHRGSLMKDKTGQYAEILKRRQGNRVASLFSGKVSAATASNIIVMSANTANSVESACGGRLKDFKTRQRIFEATYLMILVVVDTMYETCTIYHRGIALPTQVSVKAMRSNNKGGGTDVNEILKAYQLGNAPTL